MFRLPFGVFTLRILQKTTKRQAAQGARKVLLARGRCWTTSTLYCSLDTGSVAFCFPSILKLLWFRIPTSLPIIRSTDFASRWQVPHNVILRLCNDFQTFGFSDFGPDVKLLRLADFFRFRISLSNISDIASRCPDTSRRQTFQISHPASRWSDLQISHLDVRTCLVM